jgi:hypothetical protein
MAQADFDPSAIPCDAVAFFVGWELIQAGHKDL